MNRNSDGRFATVPKINIQRARFKRDFKCPTTINEGDLVPIYVDEVLPGDTINMRLNGLIRMSTPLYPVMDTCYMDTYAFFVPNRLLWEHWENLMGQNDNTFWEQTTQYSVPMLNAPANGWNVGTIADYMGIPVGVKDIKVSALPFRAYARIWNEWFRDENLQQPVTVHQDDAYMNGSNSGGGPSSPECGGLPLKVGKYHDYFTSCLPEPQKGDASTLPISLEQEAPVFTNTTATVNGAQAGLQWKFGSDGKTIEEKGSAYGARVLGVAKEDGIGTFYTNANPSGTAMYSNAMYPANLYAAVDVKSAITINDLRNAIAIQHILEADARGGTRYTEILSHEFGVNSPDARLQRSEYLGGGRIPININQVIQSSGTTSTSPQGNTAAYSLTTTQSKMCSYSATEHGYIMVLAAIRVEHSYQQGLARMWSRKNRLDFYHPMLANLGEMAVLNKEIFAQGTAKDDEVFGYQEPWADYRYHPNMITGEMRSKYAQTLDAWHYGDYYETLPTLSAEWIQEPKNLVDRTLAVQSQNAHQFICDFFFDQTWTRPMPIYGVPGLSKI